MKETWYTIGQETVVKLLVTQSVHLGSKFWIKNWPELH